MLNQMITNVNRLTCIIQSLTIITAHLLFDLNIDRYSSKKHSIVFSKASVTLTLMVPLYLSVAYLLNQTGSTSFAGYLNNTKTFVLAQILDDPVVLSRFHEYVLNVYKSQIRFIDSVSVSLRIRTMFFTCVIFIRT